MGLEGGIFIVTEGIDSDDRQIMGEGWEMVKRNVDKVAAVVKDLLYCSKMREPRFEKGASPAAIIREVHELFAKRAADDGIELRVEVDEELRGTFDPRGMHSLFSNLVANAIDGCRFDPDGGDKDQAITMRCRQGAASSIVAEVEDNGSGIPDNVHDKVFKGFFSTKGTEGTGLGLLVVQKVVDEHGGTVSFVSKEGEGTRFTAVFPAEPSVNHSEEFKDLLAAQGVAAEEQDPRKQPAEQ
jgi:signal transduction histidine kinase